jgi:hypothetical protein
MYQDQAGRLRVIESTVTRPATGLTGALGAAQRMAGVMRCRDTEMGASVDILRSPEGGGFQPPPGYRRHIRLNRNTEGVAAFHFPAQHRFSTPRS